jgi:hypothetical protein
MGTSIDGLFQRELERRGIAFTRDSGTGGYSLKTGDRTQLISLENLAREYAIDRDPECVPRFVDAILHGGFLLDWKIARESVLFCLEPNDYVESCDLRLPVSRQVDRVPVLVDKRLRTCLWVTQGMLETWAVSVDEFTQVASANLALALSSSKVEYSEIQNVKRGFFETELPIKSPLLLAPNLKEVVETIVGLASSSRDSGSFRIRTSSTSGRPRTNDFVSGWEPLCYANIQRHRIQ